MTFKLYQIAPEALKLLRAIRPKVPPGAVEETVAAPARVYRSIETLVGKLEDYIGQRWMLVFADDAGKMEAGIAKKIKELIPPVAELYRARSDTKAIGIFPEAKLIVAPVGPRGEAAPSLEALRTSIGKINRAIQNKIIDTDDLIVSQIMPSEGVPWARLKEEFVGKIRVPKIAILQETTVPPPTTPAIPTPEVPTSKVGKAIEQIVSDVTERLGGAREQVPNVLDVNVEKGTVTIKQPRALGITLQDVQSRYPEFKWSETKSGALAYIKGQSTPWFQEVPQSGIKAPETVVPKAVKGGDIGSIIDTATDVPEHIQRLAKSYAANLQKASPDKNPVDIANEAIELARRSGGHADFSKALDSFLDSLADDAAARLKPGQKLANEKELLEAVNYGAFRRFLEAWGKKDDLYGARLYDVAPRRAINILTRRGLSVISHTEKDPKTLRFEYTVIEFPEAPAIVRAAREKFHPEGIPAPHVQSKLEEILGTKAAWEELLARLGNLSDEEARGLTQVVLDLTEGPNRENVKKLYTAIATRLALNIARRGFPATAIVPFKTKAYPQGLIASVKLVHFPSLPEGQPTKATKDAVERTVKALHDVGIVDIIKQVIAGGGADYIFPNVARHIRKYAILPAENVIVFREFPESLRSVAAFEPITTTVVKEKGIPKEYLNSLLAYTRRVKQLIEGYADFKFDMKLATPATSTRDLNAIRREVEQSAKNEVIGLIRKATQAAKEDNRTAFAEAIDGLRRIAKRIQEHKYGPAITELRGEEAKVAWEKGMAKAEREEIETAASIREAIDQIQKLISELSKIKGDTIKELSEKGRLAEAISYYLEKNKHIHPAVERELQRLQVLLRGTVQKLNKKNTKGTLGGEATEATEAAASAIDDHISINDSDLFKPIVGGSSLPDELFRELVRTGTPAEQRITRRVLAAWRRAAGQTLRGFALPEKVAKEDPTNQATLLVNLTKDFVDTRSQKLDYFTTKLERIFDYLSPEDRIRVGRAVEGKIPVDKLSEVEQIAAKEYRKWLDELADYTKIRARVGDRVKITINGKKRLVEIVGEYFDPDITKSKYDVRIVGSRGVSKKTFTVPFEAVNTKYRQNYLPHVFKGQYMVLIPDHAEPTEQVRFFETLEDARQFLFQLAQAEGILNKAPEEAIKEITRRGWGIYPRYFVPYELSLFMSRQALGRLTAAIDQELKKAFGQDIAKRGFTKAKLWDILKTEIRLQPKLRYFNHLLPREKNIGHYIEDPLTIGRIYLMGAVKKVEGDKYRKTAFEIIRTARRATFGDPYWQRYWDYFTRYAEEVESAKPTRLEVIVDNFIRDIGGDHQWFYRRSLQKLSTLMTLWGLGFSPMSAIVNLSQLAWNTFPILGKWTFAGISRLGRHYYRYDPKVAQVLADLQVSLFVPKYATATLPPSVLRRVQDRLPYVALHMFNAAEYVNRAATGLGAFEKKMAEGASYREAIAYAKAIIEKTQFRYGTEAVPEILRSPTARFLAQFRPYLLFELNFIRDLVRRDPEQGYLPLVRFLTAAIATTGLVGLPFIQTLDRQLYRVTAARRQGRGFSLLQWVDENAPWALKPILLRGIPATAGVDVSGRVGVGPDIENIGDILVGNRELRPTDLARLIGPWTGRAVDIWEAALELANNKTYDALERLIQALAPVQFWYIWSAASGYYGIGGREPGALRSPRRAGAKVTQLQPHEWVLRAVGIQPTRVSEIYEIATLNNIAAQVWRAQRETLRRRLAQAARTGNTKEFDRLFQQAQSLGLTPQDIIEEMAQYEKPLLTRDLMQTPKALREQMVQRARTRESELIYPLQPRRRRGLVPELLPQLTPPLR